MRDWTAAVDDLLCGRLHCCTTCGQAPTQAWTGVWDLAHHRSIAYAVCARCKATGDGGAVLRARLEARYAVQAREEG